MLQGVTELATQTHTKVTTEFRPRETSAWVAMGGAAAH